MILLDGKKLAQNREKIFINEIKKLSKFRKPKLVVILVGNDFASLTYVKHKENACKNVGILFELKHFDENINEEELIKYIEKLNKDNSVDGILLQLPLPKKFNEEKYLQTINSNKDVDGFHYNNQGKLLQNYKTLVPATPLGVFHLLDEYGINVDGKNCVVIGASNIVGKPLANMLINKHATVSVCQKNTNNLKNFTLSADIIFTATGRELLITKDMVKQGVVIIDIGITRDSKTNKLVGDVDFQNVKELASYITPVPGGVGPMTISALIENLIYLYKIHITNSKI